MPMPRTPKRSVLVLYDEYSLASNFVREHLASFRRHLPCHVHYAAATHDRKVRFDLGVYDVVIIHFSVRIALGWHLSPDFAEKLSSFGGLKIACIQDEYDQPHVAARWIRDLGIKVVFTCVPERDREVFYPRALVGGVEFVQNLTGYVAPRLERVRLRRPLGERPIVIGYRGRELPFRYGQFSREKLTIGIGMKAVCEQHRIPHDIEWTDDKRLPGDDWYRFLCRCRTTLSTESGSNIVDADGSLARAIAEVRRAEPAVTFDAVFERFLRPYEGHVHMNQVPPKLFEAIAFRTGLVLFEGHYSGVVRPDEHYIPLKKDFSNIDDVLTRVRDIPYLEAMTERAHRDVIRSGRYRYAVLGRMVTEVIERLAPPARPPRWTTIRVPSPAFADPCLEGEAGAPLQPQDYPQSRPRPPLPPKPPAPLPPPPLLPPPLLPKHLHALWMKLPQVIRLPIRRAVKPFAKNVVTVIGRGARTDAP
jgi:hypothetical protein